MRPWSFEQEQIFVGRYHSGSDYTFNAIDVRANGSFRTWNSMCLRQAGESGIWKPDAERCIHLLTQTHPCRICSLDDKQFEELAGEPIGLHCCLDHEDPEALVSSDWGKLCVDEHGTLRELHVGWDEKTFDRAYQRVDGYPGANPERRSARFDVYAYKLAGACERDDDRVLCSCATNRDLATLDRAALRGRLDVEAVEPLRLESLRGHNLVELHLIDPHLTACSTVALARTGAQLPRSSASFVPEWAIRVR